MLSLFLAGEGPPLCFLEQEHRFLPMITSEALTGYIQRAIPDAGVKIEDRTGTMDHFRLKIVSEVFRDKGLLDRHRLVYQALDDPMKDGRIHAVEIKALTPEEDQ